MREEDILYHSLQPDGKTVMETARLSIRELVRKNAYTTKEILSQCPAASILLSETKDPDRIGSLISSEINDQYRFFGYGLWGVFMDGIHIGLAGLKNGRESSIGEISYAILEKYRRQGLMFEAMLALLDYAKEQGFHSVEAVISDDNIPSIRFFQKLKNKYYENTGSVQDFAKINRAGIDLPGSTDNLKLPDQTRIYTIKL